MAILTLFAEPGPISFTAASAAGDEFDNAAGTSGLQISNGSAGDLRVEFVEQHACNFGGQGVHVTRIVTVPAGTIMWIPRFQMWRYNNASKRVEMLYPDGVVGLGLIALTSMGYSMSLPSWEFADVKTIILTSATLGIDDDVILVDDDAAGSTVTLTLPVAASNSGRAYYIKKLGTTANVTMDGNGATIDGAPTHTIFTQYGSRTIVCDGSNWHVL